MSLIRVRQVYFNEDQTPFLEWGYFEPYFNKKCNVFFENQIIRDLITNGDHLGHDYYGVTSYSLRQKINVTKQWKSVFAKNESHEDFDIQKFWDAVDEKRPDAMSFTRHPAQDQILVAERFHPGFTELWREILNRAGFYWQPEIWNGIIYCNSFIARSEIYESYVKDMLIPIMSVMESMPELNSPSGYKKPYPEHLKEQTGFAWYTWHSFICERLASYFFHIRDYKIISF